MLWFVIEHFAWFDDLNYHLHYGKVEFAFNQLKKAQ